MTTSDRPAEIVAVQTAPLAEAHVRGVTVARDARFAQNTQRGYGRAWARFQAWARRNGYPCDLRVAPLRPDVIAAYLAASSLGTSSLRVALASIAAASGRAWPAEPLPTKAPLVSDVMRGLVRTRGQPPRKAEALLAHQVAAIIGAARGLAERAMFAAAFSGAFRRSELVAIRRADLAFEPEGIDVLIPRSKGDQGGAGQRVFLARNSRVPEICPVSAVEAWIDVAPASEWLFPGRRGAHKSADAFVRALQGAAAKAGMTGRFSGHSLRRGHVTQARLDGRELDAIQRQTRHRNLATLLGYLGDVDRKVSSSSADLGASGRPGETDP